MEEEDVSSTSITYTSKEDNNLQSLLCKDRQYLQAFCDVTINVDVHELRAHRVILAAHSNYFNKRLKNNINTDLHAGHFLEVECMNWKIVKLIIDFMYTSDITVTSENVYELIVAADYFQMPEVKKFCINFLGTFLCSANCLKILEFARSRNIEHLMTKATDYIYNNFKYVISSSHFKQLKVEELHELIRPADKSQLVKICESLIFEAIVEWTNENTYRRKHFEDLFNLIALNKLKLLYLTDSVANEELVKSSLPCLQSVLEAIQMHCGPGKEETLPDQEVAYKLTQQRNQFTEYFMCDHAEGTWFVISSKWLNQWVKYVTNDGYDWLSQMKLPRHPGPIDNAVLFTNKSFGMLKTTIKAQDDYKFIPQSAWLALVEWYGVVEGQPPITEKGLLTNERKVIGIEDEICVVDPVELRLCFIASDKTIKKVFSQWDLMSEVEAKMKNLFNIPICAATKIYNGLNVLDGTKTIKENNITGTEIKIVISPPRSSVRELKLTMKRAVSSSAKSKTSNVSKATQKANKETNKEVSIQSIWSHDIKANSSHSKDTDPSNKVDSKELHRETTIHVIGFSVSEEKAKEHFSKFGKITKINIAQDKRSGFVTFDRAEAAAKAVQERFCKPIVIDGWRVVVL